MQCVWTFLCYFLKFVKKQQNTKNIKKHKNAKGINRKLQRLKAAHFLAWLAQAVEINLFPMMLFCAFAAVVDVLVCCSGLIQRLTARPQWAIKQYSVASPRLAVHLAQTKQPYMQQATLQVRCLSGTGVRGRGKEGECGNLCLFVERFCKFVCL